MVNVNKISLFFRLIAYLAASTKVEPIVPVLAAFDQRVIIVVCHFLPSPGAYVIVHDPSNDSVGYFRVAAVLGSERVVVTQTRLKAL